MVKTVQGSKFKGKNVTGKVETVEFTIQGFILWMKG
jgi:hypothetical protein